MRGDILAFQTELLKWSYGRAAAKERRYNVPGGVGRVIILKVIHSRRAGQVGAVTKFPSTIAFENVSFGSTHFAPARPGWCRPIDKTVKYYDTRTGHGMLGLYK